MWQCQYNKFVKLIIHSNDDDDGGSGDNVVFIATIFHNYCTRSLVCVHLFVCLLCRALLCLIFVFVSLLCVKMRHKFTFMSIFSLCVYQHVHISYCEASKLLHRHSCTMHVLMGLLRTSVHYMKYVNPFTFSPFPFCRQNESWISVHVLASHCWINISLFAWTKTSKYASEINGSNVFYCICDQLTLIRCTHMSSFRLIHWELTLYLLPKKKNEHSQ